MCPTIAITNYFNITIILITFHTKLQYTIYIVSCILYYGVYAHCTLHIAYVRCVHVYNMTRSGKSYFFLSISKKLRLSKMDASPLKKGKYFTLFNLCSNVILLVMNIINVSAWGCGQGKRYTTWVCYDCPVGTYQNQNSHYETSCKVCTPGFYGGYTRLTWCGQCPVGQYTDQNTQQWCKWCPKGQYQNNVKKTSCIKCGIGKYQDESKQTWCKVCGKGKSQNLQGQQSCKTCGKGSYAHQEGLQWCWACEQGKYQNQVMQACVKKACSHRKMA